MTRYPLFLYLFIQLVSTQVWSENNEFKKILIETTKTIETAGIIDYKTNCSSCPSKQDDKKKSPPPKSYLYSKENHQKISLSILTPKEANDLFATFTARTDIPYRHIQEGCYARAHKMATLMDERGIISGKAFIEGDLVVDSGELFGKVRWSYHVAPIILVKKNNKLIPTIFDPSLFNGPVPYEEWKKTIAQNSQTVISHEYFTNRFSYDFPDRLLEFKSYKEEDLIDMEIANKKNGDSNRNFKSKEQKDKNEDTNRFNLHTEQ